MTKYDVIKAGLEIDWRKDDEEFYKVWEELYLPILEKCEKWEDSIDGLADDLTRKEERFICDSMGIDKVFYNENNVYCVYWFIKKLMINNLEGLDYCETAMQYMDSLAKLVKSYIFDC